MSFRIVVLFGLIAGVSGTAHAITCYEIVDARDSTLYRAAVPPFALSGAEWTNGQTRLRQQGRHLLWFDSSLCPEDFGPAYASAKPPEDATDLLPSRRGLATGGVYTRETTNAGAVGAGGRVPVVVVPSGAGPMTAPSGARGYGK